MKKYLLAAILIVSIALPSCIKNHGKLIRQEKTKIKSLAGQINQDFVKIRRKILQVAHYTEDLYTNQSDYAFDKNTEKVSVSPDGVLYKPQNDGGSAIFVSGIVPISEKILKIVKFTAPLDIEFKKIISEFQEVVQVYYNDEYSYNRIYPFFDVLSQYEPKMDIPKFNFYYLVDNKHNPDRKALWVDEPYVDPAGRGWMVSAIAPVYYQGRLVGVPGMDVTVNTIIDRYLKNNPNMFIMDKTGVLVAVEDHLVHVLSIPPLENHQYHETIKKDLYRKDDYNLLKSKSRTIRKMAESILISGKESASLEAGDQDYMAVSTFIEELQWHLTSIITI